MEVLFDGFMIPGTYGRFLTKMWTFCKLKTTLIRPWAADPLILGAGKADRAAFAAPDASAAPWPAAEPPWPLPPQLPR